MINSTLNNYKYTKQLLGFLFFATLGCMFYFLWGLWALYVDNIIYDKPFPNNDFVTKTILGFIQAMLLQIMTGLFLICSFCCLQPLYRVMILKKGTVNSCHGIQMLLLLIPIFCLYLGYYNMEAHFQKAESPEIFSKSSVTYLLAGFLKPLPTLSILGIGILYDEMEKKKGQTVHTDSSNKQNFV